MDLGVFYEVIVPLMKVRNTAIICISTPLGAWNFYSELTEIKNEHGRPLFNVIKVGMACARCRGTEREAECTHPSTDLPEWNDDAGIDKIKAIMGTRKTLLQREIMGVVADDDNAAFSVHDVKAFYARAPTTEPHVVVPVLYVALDPNGGCFGTTGSETAICSIFYSGANVVVSDAALRAAASISKSSRDSGCA